MKDSLYYFLLGFMSMAVVDTVIISYNTIPGGDTACGKCGSYEWYFKIAEGEENDYDM